MKLILLTDPVEFIEYTLTEDTEFLQIEMINRIDGNFKIKEILLVVEDTDSDGIPNHLEVDSDNDGCYDANEAGFTRCYYKRNR